MFSSPARIPDDVLAEHWFSFVHSVIGKLQSAFRSSGLSQKDIGDTLGRQPAFISRCLRGQQNMTIRTIFEIARAMGYRLEITFRPLNTLRPANLQPQSFPTTPPVRTAATAGSSIIYSNQVPTTPAAAIQ